MIKKVIATIFIFASTSTAFGLTSVCSGELLPLTGLNTLKHEASWSYYDNWYYNMFVEISSEVDGPVSPSLVEEVEMEVGGSVLHFLDSPPNGHYTLRGYVQIGYPLSWGFDGYYGIECPSWNGDITNADNVSSTGNDGRLVGVGSGRLSVRVISNLNLGAETLCAETNAASCAVIDAHSAANAAAYSKMLSFSESQLFRRTTTAGIVEAIGEESLVIRTAVGRLVRYAMGNQFQLTRHTSINSSEIGVGDFVGVYWSSANENDSDALSVRVYRGEISPQVSFSEIAVPSKTRGIEFRSVVTSVERFTQGDLRLVYEQGSTTMLVPNSASVTVIEPALLRDLVSFSTEVHVLGQLREDGSLVVRAIEIHQ